MKITRLLLTTLGLMLCITTFAFAGSDAPFGIQVVRQEAVLMDEEGSFWGTAEFWNTRNNFIVELGIEGDWQILDTQVYGGEDPPTLKKNKNKPIFGKYPCKRDFAPNTESTMVQCG